MRIDPHYYGLIEMGMTFGVVAIFTIHQLWSLRDKPGENQGNDEPKDDRGEGEQR